MSAKNSTVPRAKPDTEQMGLLRILGIGACHVHDPLYSIWRRSLASAVAAEFRSQQTLYAHCVEEAEQLVAFLRGAAIPDAIRPYLYIDAGYDPSTGNGAAVDTADVALFEVCSPLRIQFRGHWLNRNEIWRVIGEPLDKAKDPIVAAARNWYLYGLLKQDEEKRREFAEFFLAGLPEDTEEQAMHRAVVREASSERASVDEIAAGIERLRATLGIPLGIVLHTHRHMPDGRPLNWPPEFHDDMRAICRRLEIPLLDPTELIMDYGAEKALQVSLHYYTEPFIQHLGEHFLDFARRCMPDAETRPRVPVVA